MNEAKRRQWVNISLVALAVAGVIAVIATTGRVTTGEKEARSQNVLAAYREDDITRIAIEQAGKRLVIERERDDAGDSDWYIREPIEEEAEAYAMEKLLGTLEFASFQRRIKPEEVDRQRFGLNDPQMVVRVQMGGISYRLLLGKKAPAPANSHYLEVAGDGVPNEGVVTVSDDLVAELGVGVEELRGRQMVPYLSSATTRIELTGAGGTRKLVRAPWGWRFADAYGKARVDPEAFDRVLLQFARAKAETFIDQKAAKQGLAEGDSVSIRMVHEDQGRPEAKLRVGGKCPADAVGVVALRLQPDPVAACVPETVMIGLTVPAEELLDRSLYSVAQDAVESLTISRGKKKLELERKGSGFVLRAPKQAEVELEAGNQRLAALVSARGQLVPNPDLKELGLDPPRGRAVVKSLGEAGVKVVEETLLLGKPADDGSLAVRRMQDDTVLMLDQDTARVLAPDASLVRSRQVFDFDPRNVDWVEVESAGVRQRAERTDAGEFDLVRPKGFRVDPGLASDLFDALARLDADRWVADEDDGSFGLGKPVLRARLGVGDKQHEVLVGAPTSGGAFAKLSDDPGIFVLPKRTLDTLRLLMIERTVLQVDPKLVERIVIEHDGQRLELEKSGMRFVSDRDLSSERVNDIVDTLIGLRAEGAIHTGAAKPPEGLGDPVMTIEAEPEPGLEDAEPVQIVIGAGDSWRGISIYYARKKGVNATFAVSRAQVQRILDAL